MFISVFLLTTIRKTLLGSKLNLKIRLSCCYHAKDFNKKTMHTASIEKLLISTADTHQFNCNIIIGSQLQQKSRGLR